MFAVSAEQRSVPDDLMGQIMGGDLLGHQFIGPDMRVAGCSMPRSPPRPGAPAATRLLAFAGRKVSPVRARLRGI